MNKLTGHVYRPGLKKQCNDFLVKLQKRVLDELLLIRKLPHRSKLKKKSNFEMWFKITGKLGEKNTMMTEKRKSIEASDPYLSEELFHNTDSTGNY